MKKSLFVLAVLCVSVLMSFSFIEKNVEADNVEACTINYYSIVRYPCGDVYYWEGSWFGSCGTFGITGITEVEWRDVCIHDHAGPDDLAAPEIPVK